MPTLDDFMAAIPDAETVGGDLIHGVAGERATLGRITSEGTVALTEEGQARYEDAKAAAQAAAIAAAKAPAGDASPPTKRRPTPAEILGANPTVAGALG